MKNKTSLILFCAAALHANAQISTTVQVGNLAPKTVNGAGANGEIYSDAHLDELAGISAAQGPSGGTVIMSLSSDAICNSASGETSTADAVGTIQDTMFIKSPGVANLSLSAPSGVIGSDFFSFGEVCAGSNGTQLCSPTGLNQSLPVGNAVALSLEVRAHITCGPVAGVGGSEVDSLASFDNIVPLDKYGKPMSDVKYCTASGRQLPVQNGSWETCFPPNWTVAGPVQGQQLTTVGNLFVNGPLRQLYVPVPGPPHEIQVFNADSLAPTGQIADVDAVGVTVSAKSGRGFSSSNPVVMWDAASLRVLTTIALGAGVRPGAILLDPVNDLVYLFHQEAPLATILRASD